MACGYDTKHQLRAEVVSNLEIAPQIFNLTVKAEELAKFIKPGQFAQLQAGDNRLDPLLPRPISFFDWDAEKGTVSFLYHQVGKGTKALALKCTGDYVELWGPLGNGWDSQGHTSTLIRSNDEEKSLIPVFVAGGIGIAPLYKLAKSYVAGGIRGILLYGGRCSASLFCVDAFCELGIDVRLATEDGSVGKKGRVTDLLAELEFESGQLPKLYTCGPKPMMAAVAKVAVARNWPCQVTLEERMACGIGACLACVCKVRSEDSETGWTHKKSCVDGPVFLAEEVVWE